MANKKSSFLYYNVDTDRYNDIRIKRLKRERKRDGIAIYDYILCEIYREKGYYIEWNAESIIDTAEYWNVDEAFINDIVNDCLDLGLFDKKLFKKENVLSSYAIQKRYIDWSTKAKRKDIIVLEKYEIIQEECAKLPEQSDILTEETLHSSGSLPGSKVKESKVKESKVKESKEKEDLSAHTSEEIEAYTKFQKWIDENAPSVAKMKEPFTIKQFVSIKKEYPIAVIQRVILAMHNWTGLLSKRTSANLTFKTWAKNEE